MDLVRNDDSEYRQQLAALYRYKYSLHEIGMLIIEGEPALKFFSEEGKDLFPDVPVLCIYGPEIIKPEEASRQIILMPFDQDVRGTLEYALDLLPDIKRVIYVCGSTEVERRREKVARDTVFVQWIDKLEFEYTSDLSYDEMMERISNQPPNTIIIFTYFFADKNETAFIPRDVAKKIIEVTNAPVFGIYETLFDVGIVGGSIARFGNDGDQSANLTLDIINGKIILSESVTTVTTIKTPMFDWRELKRWGLDVRKIPEGSILLNYEPSFWELYKNYVIGGLIFCLAQMFIIGALLIQRRRLQAAEKAIKESDVLYRDLIETAQDLIWQCDAEGRYTYLNPAWEQVFGYKIEEMLGKRFSDFQTPEYAERVLKEFAQLLKGNTVKGLETVHLGKDGREIHLVFNAKFLVDEVGSPAGTRGTAYDITERVLTVEALRALSTRQEAILAAVPDIIVEVDKDKVYTWANPASLEFFGEDAIGKEAAFYFEGEQDTYGVVQPLFNGCENVIYLESWQRRKDGQKRLLAWWCRVLKDAEENVTGALSTARDITERKEAEEAIRRHRDELEQRVAERTAQLDARLNEVTQLNLGMASLMEDLQSAQHTTEQQAKRLTEVNAELESFTYSVSHDLRAPLRAVQGFAEILSKEYPAELDPRGQSYADYIVSAARQMDALILDLLAYSRLTSSEIRLECLDLGDLINKVLTHLASAIQAADAQVQAAGDFPQVIGQAAILGQVIENLLSNALKFVSTDRTPQVSIRAEEKPGGWVRLWVEDNGIGIAP
ncbi:MAG: PAS domain S-box protein, partial [Chloroflexota bacterium]